MKDYSEIIKKHLEESAHVKKLIIEKCTAGINEAADMIGEAFTGGHKLFLCGNGGSAADSQHLATEFVIRLSSRCERGSLPAIALTTNTSSLTAGANDYGFDYIFSRQIQGLGAKGDVLIAISTSGNSMNIIRAVETARDRQMHVIGLLGGTGGKLKALTDIPIVIPALSTERIQEGHITVGHILCHIIEKMLFPDCFA